MWDEIIKAFSVYLSTMIKFIFGPIGGKAAGLHLITTMIVTAAGMMTIVVAFTYFGELLRAKVLHRFFPKKASTEQSPRKRSAFLTKYGLASIAFFTPLILTPIGGTLLAVSVSSNREKIIFYMLISACVWSVILTLAVYFGYDAVMNFVNKVQPV